MVNRKRALLMMCIPVLSIAFIPRDVHAQTVHTIYNTAVPSVIRVAIRPLNNPRGPILWVQTVGFQNYCEDVLPNEWMPSWDAETLRAGAIAVKMFGWYHTLHPITMDGWTFDVDNTTNFQEYNYRSGTYSTDRAIHETWRTVYVPSTGEVKELDYRAGAANEVNWAFLGTNIMSQWGSQYWGAVGRLTYPSILRMYYTAREIRGI